MKGSRSSSRYAKSLLLLATERNELDRTYSDMALINETCKANRDFILFLRSPIVKADKKCDVIRKVFGGQLGELVMGFVDIIARHHRENHLPEIAESFVLQYKAQKNIATAEIITAVKLDEKIRKAILDRITQIEGRQVELKEKVDPSLLGGMIVRVGDRQYDASISRKLKQLKKDFSKNAYISQL